MRLSCLVRAVGESGSNVCTILPTILEARKGRTDATGRSNTETNGDPAHGRHIVSPRGEVEGEMAGSRRVSVDGGSDEVRQFERHVLVYLDDLYRVALHLTGQATEAEDLVQETCVRAFKALDRLKRRSVVKVWVFSILRSTLLCQVARGPVRGTLASVHDIAGSLPTPTDALLDACESVLPIRQSLSQETRDAILKLPLPYREAVILAHIGGFSYRDMARVLALPVGTVMSRLFRARRMLRAYLAERVSRDADDVPAPPPARFPADHGSR